VTRALVEVLAKNIVSSTDDIRARCAWVEVLCLRAKRARAKELRLGESVERGVQKGDVVEYRRSQS
jgi:hypothetical protein